MFEHQKAFNKDLHALYQSRGGGRIRLANINCCLRKKKYKESATLILLTLWIRGIYWLAWKFKVQGEWKKFIREGVFRSDLWKTLLPSRINDGVLCFVGIRTPAYILHKQLANGINMYIEKRMICWSEERSIIKEDVGITFYYRIRNVPLTMRNYIRAFNDSRFRGIRSYFPIFIEWNRRQS